LEGELGTIGNESATMGEGLMKKIRIRMIGLIDGGSLWKTFGFLCSTRGARGDQCRPQWKKAIHRRGISDEEKARCREKRGGDEGKKVQARNEAG